MAYAYYPVANETLVAPTPRYATVYVPMSLPVLPVMPSQAPLSEEEQLNGEIPKTCSRCGALYARKDDTGEACRYHCGRFMDGQQMTFWTCCKQLLRDSAGCVRTRHVASEQASADLKKFIMMTNEHETRRTVTPSMLPLATTDPEGNLDAFLYTGSPTTTNTKKKRVIRADNSPVNGVVIHTISPTDTLDGISIKYDISKAELIKANRGLSPSNFAAYRQLVIPAGEDTHVIITEMLSPEEKRLLEEERLRTKFIKQFKVSKEEASSYLASNGWDFEKAAADYSADVSFEASLVNKASSSSSSQNKAIFSSRSTQFPSTPSATRK